MRVSFSSNTIEISEYVREMAPNGEKKYFKRCPHRLGIVNAKYIRNITRARTIIYDYDTNDRYVLDIFGK